jgi:hypothetical protein
MREKQPSSVFGSLPAVAMLVIVALIWWLER